MKKKGEKQNESKPGGGSTEAGWQISTLRSIDGFLLF